MMVNCFLMFLFDYCNSSIMWSPNPEIDLAAKCSELWRRTLTFRNKKMRPYNSCHERVAPIILILILILIVIVIIIYFRLQIYLKGRDLTC